MFINLFEGCTSTRTQVQSQLQKNRERNRVYRSSGSLPKFSKGDFVLLARTKLHGNEKLCIRWRGPLRVIKPLSDYIFLAEDVRNDSREEAYICRLEYYHDADPDTEAILSHVLHSETGMPVQCLLSLEDLPNGFFVKIR